MYEKMKTLLLICIVKFSNQIRRIFSTYIEKKKQNKKIGYSIVLICCMPVYYVECISFNYIYIINNKLRDKLKKMLKFPVFI